MRKALFFLLIVWLAGTVAQAQDRCGAVEYRKGLLGRNQVRENPVDFERWLEEKTTQRVSRRSGRTQATYQIPVVVHVIHNGEAVGTGRNIPDAQILSQLSVLNKDYNRQNTDAGNTPAEFLPVAGAFNIEFVLARQDPEGLPTTGIVRLQGPKPSWSMNDNYQLKALSYWPAEDYLNIWVCQLTDYLGFAQFPVSALPGLENSSTNRLTDGVVISYNAFGSIDDGAFNLQNVYNKGRTTTHEVGHFFGLNHIWGDDDNACTGTDYVDDTPNQAGSSGGCPSHPRVTCEVTSMFQNYLDYTNDACMNLFTAGQVARMEVVIENSPRRASLTTSHGLNEPAALVNDLGLKSIIQPGTGACTSDFVPQVEVRNYGSNTVTSARIQLRKDGVITETKDFSFSTAIGLLEARTLAFSEISFSSGTHNIAFEILLTNGVADGQASNNSMSRTVTVPGVIAVPFLETFNTLPANWLVLNPDQHITWALAATGSNGNSAIKLDFYNYEDHVGEIDALVTPVFDLADAPAALLKFDVAYAQYASSKDGLKVLLLNDCNTDLENGIVIYSKSGGALATTSATSSEFTPAANQWRTETVDLSAHIGRQNLQLAFVGANDWGNNLYLDNISLTTAPIADVVARKIRAPSPVSCAGVIDPIIRVFNAGTLITQLTVTTTINGVSHTQVLEGLSIPGNTEADLTLAAINVGHDENSFEVLLSNPNGIPDFFPDNNALDMVFISDQVNGSLPLRLRFDDGRLDNWTMVNPAGGMNWQPVDINGNTALYVNGFANSAIGDQSWLVTPILDFSGIGDALLSFDDSYAARQNRTDIFYILASRDCGISYSDTLLRVPSRQLARGRLQETSWQPSTSTDWSNRSISLASLADETAARIAFVFENGQGNNLYIDNIEFFLTSNPMKITGAMSIYPTPLDQPWINATFNLPEKSDVRIDIIDNLGRILRTDMLPGVLNQTYTFDLHERPGLYYLRATTNTTAYVERFIIAR